MSGDVPKPAASATPDLCYSPPIMRRTCLVAALSTVLMVPLIIKAQAPQSAAGDIELQLGDLLAAEGRFREAIVPYRRAVAAAADDEGIKRQARTGLTLALLRAGDFAAARTEAQQLVDDDRGSARAQALLADTLWASGLFDEAEAAYDGALKSDEGEARAHHGRARMLAARNRLDEALVEAQEAVRLAPREAEFHHTAGVIYERQHRFEEAAVAYRQLRQPAARTRIAATRRRGPAPRSGSSIRSAGGRRGGVSRATGFLDRADSDRERQGPRARAR